jgi:hypothetical protein
MAAGIAQSVQRPTTGWKVRCLNPGGEEIIAPIQMGPPSLL